MANDDRTQPATAKPSGRSRVKGARPAGIPEAGAIVADKYEIGEVLGAGGMGVVVAGRHVLLGEPVAIKFLLPKVSRDPETVARFVREAKAAARVKSEHTARVTDVGQLPGGSPYLVMEHLSGLDLGQALERSGPLAIADAVDYVLQACLAIAEAHALGLVHRDLKPSNLFLTQRTDGTPLVKVLDFGISKALVEEGAADPGLTDTQAIFGSPTYMSPEQLRSTKKVDIRTDIWALGIVLFELLTGEAPFKGETVAGLLAAISADPPELLRAKRKEAPELLEAAIARCLEKDLTKRFQTVADFATALAPLASRTRQESIERIARLTPSLRPPGVYPPTSISGAPKSGAPSPAFAATEKPWTSGPVTNAARTRVRPAWFAALGAAAVVLVSAVVMATRSSGDATPSPAAPAISASAPIPAAIPAATLSALPVASTIPAPPPIVAADAGPPEPSAADLKKPRHSVIAPTAPRTPVGAASTPIPPAPPVAPPTPPPAATFDPLKQGRE